MDTLTCKWIIFRILEFSYLPYEPGYGGILLNTFYPVHWNLSYTRVGKVKLKVQFET